MTRSGGSRWKVDRRDQSTKNTVEVADDRQILTDTCSFGLIHTRDNYSSSCEIGAHTGKLVINTSSTQWAAMWRDSLVDRLETSRQGIKVWFLAELRDVNRFKLGCDPSNQLNSSVKNVSTHLKAAFRNRVSKVSLGGSTCQAADGLHQDPYWSLTGSEQQAPVIENIRTRGINNWCVNGINLVVKDFGGTFQNWCCFAMIKQVVDCMRRRLLLRHGTPLNCPLLTEQQQYTVQAPVRQPRGMHDSTTATPSLLIDTSSAVLCRRWRHVAWRHSISNHKSHGCY